MAHGSSTVPVGGTPARTADGSPHVGVVVPTLNGGNLWRQCLDAIRRQTLVPHRMLTIDSESSDGTATLARAAGFQVVEIPRSQFNHGGTRQWAVEHLSDCSILVFLTQDAILASSRDLEEIVDCFDDPRVAVAYGRQLPRLGANPIESHARFFNYGDETTRKDAATVKALGTKAFFCSNSFAAYRRSTLLELGGFHRDLILGEDMEFAARAIQAGYTNIYCATALVRHSHDYSVRQILARYFDLGVFEKENEWMRVQFGSHAGEGLRFVKSELRFLASRAPWAIPRALVQTAAKLLGYRLGLLERRLPLAAKRRLSMQPLYWR